MSSSEFVGPVVVPPGAVRPGAVPPGAVGPALWCFLDGFGSLLVGPGGLLLIS